MRLVGTIVGQRADGIVNVVVLQHYSVIERHPPAPPLSIDFIGFFGIFRNPPTNNPINELPLIGRFCVKFSSSFSRRNPGRLRGDGKSLARHFAPPDRVDLVLFGPGM